MTCNPDALYLFAHVYLLMLMDFVYSCHRFSLDTTVLPRRSCCIPLRFTSLLPWFVEHVTIHTFFRCDNTNNFSAHFRQCRITCNNSNLLFRLRIRVALPASMLDVSFYEVRACFRV